MGGRHRRTRTSWRTRPYSAGDKGRWGENPAKKRREALKALGMTEVPGDRKNKRRKRKPSGTSPDVGGAARQRGNR